jgi:diguanylate cyclase (GGDEF)-like protein
MLAQQIVIVHPEDMHLIHDATAQLTSGEAETLKTTYRAIRKDGTVIWMEGNARRMVDPATGRKGDLILTLRDISERKALEDKLEALATTDGLTGLANRRAFDIALDREWRRTLRDDSHLSLLLLDLDHFKGLNDNYGHQVGDDCLRAVAAAVSTLVRRPGDMVARYGGEEIAIILSGADAEGAYEMAEKVRAAVEGLRIPHASNPEGGFFLTASIGCATAFSRVGGTSKMPEGLLMSADSALYKAKHKGRNRVESTMLMTARVEG